ncbi:hypothetical protein ADEAN_000845300 [Angomonas deanei]|uniref:Uncharacterized protein n=1 Tax=Angomonas deanei TaxID=59799 RepID=A0A7G2CNL0_9TRYP|nr:hypothetical protein ADEAN_000845300 [Angomonas deanei]
MTSFTSLRTVLVLLAGSAALTTARDVCPPNCEVGARYEGDDTVYCGQCESGYDFLNGNPAVCAKLPPNCIRFQREGEKCAHCVGGHLLSKTGVCVKCPGNCVCDPDEPSKCNGCPVGKGLNDARTECLPCLDTECNYCPMSYKQCVPHCDVGSVLASNGTCVKCLAEGCRCDPDAPHLCVICLSGHYLKEGKCIPCPDGCDRCTVQDDREICLRCNDGAPPLNGTNCMKREVECDAPDSTTNTVPLIAAVSAAVIATLVLIKARQRAPPRTHTE